MYKNQRAERKAWTREETEGFLNFYKARKSEFNNSRKKRMAYYNVLNDMRGAGITGPKTTVTHLEVKMQTLQRLYRSLRNDPRKENLSTPCMIKMQEIFELDRAKHENSLNIGLSTTAKTDPVPDDYGETNIHEHWDSFSADEHIKMETDIACAYSSSPSLIIKSEENSEDTTATAVMPETLPSSTLDDHNLYPNSPAFLLNSEPEQNKRSRMNRARYLEKKLLLKIESERNRNKRWEQFKAIEEKKLDLLKKLCESIKK
ncbi:uncharacterized protein LOC129947920 [Eupeodes corollae]|uniref:uncharacterized protein LOC129947920 n=1 Tax=Eupeodes corollae TaxID=290404 RepID=UPI00249060BC|nr:uncharacterized protein LOC129947920 [Eupeodes corollae]